MTALDYCVALLFLACAIGGVFAALCMIEKAISEYEHSRSRRKFGQWYERRFKANSQETT